MQAFSFELLARRESARLFFDNLDVFWVDAYTEYIIASLSLCLWSSYKGQTVDALAPRGDEGRGRLRYASGSRQTGLDPEISEWGNPSRVMPENLLLNP